MNDLQEIRLTGSSIERVFEPLAQLRIAVFRDFPYLYDGNVSYEKVYLQTYANAERSFLYAVYDGDRMVGATTCIPLSDETDEVQQPFLKAGYALDQVFYFGESILLPEYRGRGLGHRFFEEREAHAAGFNTFKMTCFCAVQRPEDHPMRPADYQPLNAFWTKRGYSQAPALQSVFYWPDLGDSENTGKTMTYWIRNF